MITCKNKAFLTIDEVINNGGLDEFLRIIKEKDELPLFYHKKIYCLIKNIKEENKILSGDFYIPDNKFGNIKIKDLIVIVNQKTKEKIAYARIKINILTYIKSLFKK